MDRPIRGLWNVAKDGSWAEQAGCNEKPLAFGTFVVVVADSKEQAFVQGKKRLETMERNRRRMAGAND